MLGYIHKLKVEVNGLEVLFEQDEEKNYRGVIDPQQVESSKIDAELHIST